MHYITPEDDEKFKLLDLIFSSLTVDELKDMFGEALVSAKLKDTKLYNRPVSGIYPALTELKNEIGMLRGEILQQRNDIGTLIRCLSRGMGDNNTSYDFNSIKSRYGIY